MNPEMGLVPVVIVREENDRRLVLCQKPADHLDRRRPPSRVLLSRGRVKSLQASLSCANQSKANVFTAVRELLPALGLPIDAATQSDRDIDDVHLQLTQ